MLIDSHCHLTDLRFSQDRREVLLRARDAGVGGIVTVSSDAADGVRVREILEEAPEIPGAPEVWGTAGIHPHEAQEAREGDLEAVRDLAAGHPRIVAVGETGLDFYYDHSPREVQAALFRSHLELAEELGLPVVVHNRNADPEMIGILKEWGSRVAGVLHCFAGREDLLHTALGLGWMISFTGMITFKKYEDAPLLRAVPRDRLMVETDAPYLTPTPHRGRRNEPAFVVRVAEEVAALRGETYQEVLAYTTENAVRFFGLKP